mgnify:CR=1 FL=1
MLSRFLDRILTSMAVMAGLLLAFITFSIGYGIFARAVGLQSPVWTVQFNEYSLVWMTFLGSAWVLRRRKHVAVDVLTATLGPKSKSIAEVVHSLLGIAVCGTLCWYTSLMTLNLFERGVTDVQAVDMPRYLVLMVIPAGFLVLTAQFVRNLTDGLHRIIKDLQEPETQKSGTEWPSKAHGASSGGRRV